MRVSYQWLGELVELGGVTPSEAAERLTLAGLEVEGITETGRDLGTVLVAEVIASKPHPSRPQLQVVTVAAGGGPIEVVCGAPNVPAPGGRVALAPAGTRLPGGLVEARPLAGVMSSGMLCSEKELAIGDDASGLLIIDEPAPAGTPLAALYPIEDAVLEVSVTPNRGDCLSHRGIGRELAAALGRPFEPPAPEPPKEMGEPANRAIRVTIEDPEGCPRYLAAVVRGVTIAPSPFRLRRRLHVLGLRAINNVVDATNLLLLELGQPFHAFDLDRLAGAEIRVRRARPGETLQTLDGADRALVTTDLVIADAKAPVALAGVMGGLASEVTASTRNLLLECALFHPPSIRRTSKRLGLSSESSMRFERGVDQEGMAPAITKLASLVTRLSGGAAAPGIVDAEPRPFVRPRLILRSSRYRTVSGLAADGNDIASALHRLGIEARPVGDDRMEAEIPSRRPDLRREDDLVEEVARVQGYDRIPAELPRVRCAAPEPTRFSEARAAKDILASLGLLEAVNYTFVAAKDLEILGQAGSIRIANPLKEDRAHLRTTLLAGLLEDLRRAQNRRVERVRLFEVGPTFHPKPGEIFPDEIDRIAGLLWGRAEAWVGEKDRPYDFYDLKGVVEGFVSGFTGRGPVLERASDPRLHPRSSCRVLLDGAPVGALGELHPDVAERLDLEPGALVFELDLASLVRSRAARRYSPLPRFPSVVRDVALLVDAGVQAAEIAQTLRQSAGPLARQVDVFDVYQGKQVAEGKKSMAFRVTYRSDERTLTDAEVDAAHAAAVQSALAAFGAVQR